MNLKKRSLEKIYTPKQLSLFLLKQLKRFNNFNITEFLEPSAGSGQLLDVIKEQYPNIPLNAFDIKNETHRKDIIECNFLKCDIRYKKGRVTIMNPPFSKGTKFIYKCLSISDIVISITSLNTLLSLDYDKVNVRAIRIFKDYEFSNKKKYDICVFTIIK